MSAKGVRVHGTLYTPYTTRAIFQHICYCRFTCFPRTDMAK